MTKVEQKHPADELGRVLARANGILTLLSGCYEKSEARFDTGNAFVFESITAIEAMLNTATDALARLYQTCDLSVVREAEQAVQEPAIEISPVPQMSAPTPTMPIPAPAHMELQLPAAQIAQHNFGGSYLGFFGPAESAANLAERVDSILINMPLRPRLRQTEIMDKPAESFDELLEKVTALADVAAYQAHQTHQDTGLGTALEGLRADLIKLRSVA